MQNTEVSALNHTLQQTQEWLEELIETGPFENEQQAYSHFRAVLHSLRDRLTPEEAVHFASQLPMLVRGFYYEGWRLALAPNQEDTLEEFLDSIRESLGPGQAVEERQDLHESARAVFELLNRRVSEGQVRHVRGQLPDEIRALWPEG